MPTFGDMCSSCKKDWGKHYDNGKECPRHDWTRADPPGSWGYFVPCKKVKCMDASDQWAVNKLTVGKVYQVAYEDSNPDGLYRLVADDTGRPSCPAKTRFVVLDTETVPPTQRSAGVPEKTEMDFFKTPATPGNCLCGIVRQQCDYHRQ